MNITISPSTNANFKAKKLIPLKDYNGPVLKLTKSEKAKISVMQQQIMDADYELAKMYELFKQNIHNSGRCNFYESVVQRLQFQIERLKSEIQSIKSNRIQKQRKKI